MRFVLSGRPRERAVRRSTERFLTTHAGSLPYPEPGLTPDADGLAAAVTEVVRRQRDAGLDLVNEGEYTKGGDWLSFADDRFGGFEERERTGVPMIAQGRDREEFADFYQYATERGTLFCTPGGQIRARRPQLVCTGPITYAGADCGFGGRSHPQIAWAKLRVLAEGARRASEGA
jgi:5-methyltetrahydropteroyltriglutamate--homocysteine methyltransferase